MLKDGRNGKDGILAHIRVSVLEAGASGREERFDQFGLAQFAEKSESVASDVFVGVLKVIPYPVAVQPSAILRCVVTLARD